MLLTGIVANGNELRIFDKDGKQIASAAISLPLSFKEAEYGQAVQTTLDSLDASKMPCDAFLRIRMHDSLVSHHHYPVVWFAFEKSTFHQLPRDSWCLTPILGTGRWYLAHQSGSERSHVIDGPKYLIDAPMVRLTTAVLESGHILPGDDVTILPFSYLDTDDSVILTDIVCFEMFAKFCPPRRISGNHWMTIEW